LSSDLRSETAKYIQRRGGTMTGETRSRSYTGTFFRRPTGETRSEMRMPLLPIERIMSMPPDQSLVFFAGRHEPLLAGRRPYWTIPRLAGRYAPDPLHMEEKSAKAMLSGFRAGPGLGRLGCSLGGCFAIGSHLAAVPDHGL
jgi:type IV secretory pathway TraG/TraD family ATPase VirD4